MSYRTDPFDQLPPPEPWLRLEQLAAKSHEVLAEFIHGCAQDHNDRTVAVTTLVMTLWQLAGRRMSHRLPSLVLVNAHGYATDPNDMLASHFLAAAGSDGPRIFHEGYFMGGTPAQAPAMAGAIRDKPKLGAVTSGNASIHTDLENRYFDAQRTGFGYGPARAYAEAWHDAFALITDRDGELVLRLDSSDDREAFLHDVIEDPERVRAPVGYGPGLELVPKTTAISGSISAGKWNADLARGIVDLGLPMLVLPSLAQNAPVTDNLPVFELFASTLPSSFKMPVVEPANFLPDPWFNVYRDELRRRLRYLPADYEYSIHKLGREIFPVCERIAVWSASGASPREVEALWLELCMHTLRGIVLSVAGLAWCGLGFDPGAEALRGLGYLRAKGPMTKSEWNRLAHIDDKEMRDGFVERFADEGLMRVEGKTITAMTYREFVEGLYAREQLPQPVDL